MKKFQYLTAIVLLAAATFALLGATNRSSVPPKAWSVVQVDPNPQFLSEAELPIVYLSTVLVMGVNLISLKSQHKQCYQIPQTIFVEKRISKVALYLCEHLLQISPFRLSSSMAAASRSLGSPRPLPPAVSSTMVLPKAIVSRPMPLRVGPSLI